MPPDVTLKRQASQAPDEAAGLPAVPPWVRVPDLAPTKRGERTRRRIIEAAEELFRDFDNYENIAVSDIARASRTSVGTIYRYFDSKEGLLHLVLSNAFWRMYQASRGTWRKGDPPEANLRRTTETYLRAYWKERAFIRLARRLVSTSESVRELWWAMRSELRQLMRMRLEQDQAIAKVLPLDPELMIRMLGGMIDDYAARAFIDEEFGAASPADIPVVAGVIAEIWYRAVFGDGSCREAVAEGPSTPTGIVADRGRAVRRR
jgi:AcrR family transcriptional regulator